MMSSAGYFDRRLTTSTFPIAALSVTAGFSEATPRVADKVALIPRDPIPDP
jgi:hypothetical protein